MACLRQHHQFGRAAHGVLQALHHRHAQHRVACTGNKQAAASPGVLPEIARSPRERGARRLGVIGHEAGEGTQRSAVARVGERRIVGRALGRAQLRVAARQQAAHAEQGLVGAHGAPIQKALRKRLLASGQQCVHGQQADKALRHLHGQRQAQDATPILHHQHHVVQVQPLHQLQQHLAVPVKAVGTFLLGLVALAKADQVGGNDAVAGLHKDRQHVPVQVAPGRVAVQAQPGDGRIARAFVEVVQAPTRQRGQVAHVVRCPGVAGQAGKARLGRAQRIVAQWVGGQRLAALLLAAGAEELGQQRPAFLRQHPALHLGVVVEQGLGKQIHHRSGRAGLGVCCAVHHARQPRVQERTAAHGTGLQRHIERAVLQPVVAQLLRRRPQSDDFGMGCGVVPCHRGVAASGNQLVATHQHGAHRHLACLRCSLRLRQSQAHPVLILHKVHCYYFDSFLRLSDKR